MPHTHCQGGEWHLMACTNQGEYTDPSSQSYRDQVQATLSF